LTELETPFVLSNIEVSTRIVTKEMAYWRCKLPFFLDL